MDEREKDLFQKGWETVLMIVFSNEPYCHFIRPNDMFDLKKLECLYYLAFVDHLPNERMNPTLPETVRELAESWWLSQYIDYLKKEYGL